MMARGQKGEIRSGFTRIELVAVIVAIGLLLAVFLPALTNAKQHSRRSHCSSNLKQIGLAAALYAQDHDNSFFHVGGSIPNEGQWTLNPESSEILSPSHRYAYWGIGYWNYYGGRKEIFGCPSAQTVDEWRENRDFPKKFWRNSTYGIPNKIVSPFRSTSAISGPMKLTSYKSPQTMIFCQDAAEQKMEGDRDTLALFPGETQILEQWIGNPPGSGGLSRSHYNGYRFEWEWYRHDKVCNTLWVPGNVSGIKFKDYKGVDYRWYTGEEPEELPDF